MAPNYYTPAARGAISFGLSSGYRIISVMDVKHINFDHSVHAHNLHFKRSEKIDTTLLIDIGIKHDTTSDKVSLNILNYFDADGSISTKAPKFFLCNGMPINLICPPIWRTSKYA